MGISLRVMKIGFIGSGKMATALVQGVIKSGVCSAAEITVSDAIPSVAASLAASSGATAVASNAELAARAEVVVLAVKPQDAIAALEALPKREASECGLLLSIVAGLTIARLEQAAAGKFRVIRAMPNTPALILQGASGFATGPGTTAEDADIAKRVFGSVGVAVQVKESLLDAVTGLSGSGPAYIYTIIEALADGGVLMGLPRELALQLSAQTVAGAAGMVLQTGTHPATLRDQVTSPGGTTIAGLEQLEAKGLRTALISAVRAATARAKELGQ